MAAGGADPHHHPAGAVLALTMDMPRAQRTEVIATAYRASPESSHSAVSWAAIISGAVVAAAVSLILVALGSSWGLSVVSPWTGGPSATTFTVMTAIWREHEAVAANRLDDARVFADSALKLDPENAYLRYLRAALPLPLR